MRLADVLFTIGILIAGTIGIVLVIVFYVVLMPILAIVLLAAGFYELSRAIDRRVKPSS